MAQKSNQSDGNGREQSHKYNKGHYHRHGNEQPGRTRHDRYDRDEGEFGNRSRQPFGTHDDVRYQRHVMRGRGRGRHSQHQSGHCYTEEELQIFFQYGPDEVAGIIQENEARFLNTFKVEHYCKHPLKLKQLIKLLYSLVKSEVRLVLLAQIFSPDGDYSTFMIELDKLLKKMPVEGRAYIRKENPVCLGHLIEIGQVAIEAIPSAVVFVFPITVLQQTVKDLVFQGDHLPVLEEKLEALCADFEEERMKILRQNMEKQKRGGKDPAAKREPLEPFTELSVVPTLKELSINSRDVFLRPNVVDGSGYENWQHYFDVQFRLLREDFVRPLREGIEEYCKSGSSSKISDIRVYGNVRILHPVCLFSGMGFKIKFDVSRLRKVNWDHSRRLIFGSLLCLSSDAFRDEVMYATVVDRKAKDLEDGLLTVKFENGENVFAIDPKISFQMVESEAYFEAYRHILTGITEISRNPDAMPMKKYIVDPLHSINDIEPPSFLKQNAVFDMRAILNTRRPFMITDLAKWPTEVDSLDPSQLSALKMALTQEIAVIQGPPGTGKTYIGLKIVEAYLRNRNVWDPQGTSPILVICYTNHALDQFLEEIQMIKNLESSIVRVGGRCKSESLSKCLLREKVQHCRSNKNIPNGIYRAYQAARSDMSSCQNEIQSEMEDCDAVSRRKIVELSHLSNVMDKKHATQLQFDRATEARKEIEVWLGLWFPEAYTGSSADVTNSTLESEEDLVSEQIARLPLDPQLTDEVFPTADPVDDNLSGDEYIEVDSEARLLQEERKIDGDEDFELFSTKKKWAKKEEVAKKSSSDGWNVVQLPEKKRRKLLSEGFNCEPMTEEEVSHVKDVWKLNKKKRWQLYLYWMNAYMLQCKAGVNAFAIAYNASCQNFNQGRKEIECFAAKGADIIGMTTTGAAKYRHLLKQLHPKIVLFEEAAEILEAHVVTSISSSVQQVIMIGDHKQLRPKPNCYKLEHDFSLGVSLFERLVNPKSTNEGCRQFPLVTLEVQHRMRPEICSLIRPSIYKRLLDHKKVEKYGNVAGIGKNLFFIGHTSPEEDTFHSDLKSHVNKFEAEYVVQLCHYLLKQGYPPGDITILTMYRGQLFELKTRMKRQDFEGVRVAAVDDFQGEENEIIILSLVRSNSDGKIGFLNIENRVCVSLSRAKKGLYIVGNDHMLRDKHQTKWPDILKYMQKSECVGKGLPLYCQNHPNETTLVCTPDDFKKRPEGGCQKVCGERLPCGHSCPRFCHIKDARHEMGRCTKVCSKRFSCGHFCQQKCFQCLKERKCKPCSQHVDKKLPSCGHIIQVVCSAPIMTVSCPRPCDKILPCEHTCKGFCSAPCTVACKELLVKILACGHKVEVLCYQDPESISCPVKCNSILDCGDQCVGTCGKCKKGRLHEKCKRKCGRLLMCGHTCDSPCPSICPPCGNPCNNYCMHSQCPKKCYEPCDPCMEPCKWKCPHLKCTKPCGELCDRPPCNKPCMKRLPSCDHPCIGLCGEHCPMKCRICDEDEVCAIFFGSEDEKDARFIELQDCRHIFEVNGFDQWMETDTSANGEVMFKRCPKCNVSIRKSVRYGNFVKKVLSDVQAIKLKQLEESNSLTRCVIAAKGVMKDVKTSLDIDGIIGQIEEEIETTPPHSYRAATIKFQLSLLSMISRLHNLIEGLESISQITISGCDVLQIKHLLSDFSPFLRHSLLSQQQKTDIAFEMRRVSSLVKIFDLLSKFHVNKCKVLQADHDSLFLEIKELYEFTPSTKKVSEEKEKAVMALIKEQSARYNVDGLSEKEKIEIVSAIGLSKGHWYKCPKGHYYCIGECGGAMEMSKCPDCGATVGGTRHNLVEGNAHAGEMDESQHPAWSDAANMENFDPAELARLRQ